VHLTIRYTMIIKRLEEFLIDEATHQKIEELLLDSFDDYPQGRTYYKQLPCFRFLAWEADQLVGHLAVEHRIINVGGVQARIFGVVDLCVRRTKQHQKIGSQLLNELETLGQEAQIDFIVLVAYDKQLYIKNKFQETDNICRWLLINDAKTFGVSQRSIGNSLMVKPLGKKEWNEGILDFLGHIF